MWSTPATTRGGPPGSPGHGPAPAFGPPPGWAPAPASPYAPPTPGSTPNPPHPPRPGTGLATAALATGIVALTGVPFSVGLLGLVGAVGIALGVAAHLRIRRGRGEGGTRATVGMVVSAVAVALGAVIAVQFGPDAYEDLSERWHAGEAAEAPDDDADADAWDRGYEAGYDSGWDEGWGAAVDRALVAPRSSPTGGLDWTEDQVKPLALGEAAVVGAYTVTVTAIDTEADDAIEAAFEGNPPPRGRFVLATLVVTNGGAAPSRPSLDLLVSYWGEDGTLYDDWACTAWTARPSFEVGPLAPGAAAEYDVCMDVPLSALDDWSVVVEDAHHLGAIPVRWLRTS